MLGGDESVLEKMLVPVSDVLLDPSGSELTEDGRVPDVVKGTSDVEEDSADVLSLANSVFYCVYYLAQGVVGRTAGDTTELVFNRALRMSSFLQLQSETTSPRHVRTSL